MPAAAITAISSFFVSAGVSAAAATFLATTFVYVASAVALNAASRALAPKRRGNGLGAGSEVNYFDTAAGLRIVYGKAKVGAMETIPPLTIGLNNRELVKLHTIAGHEIDSYNSFHFDASTIAVTDIASNKLTNAASDGLIISGVYSGNGRIRYFRGNSLAPRSDIDFGVLGLDCNANDIATAAIGLYFNPTLYPSPPVITYTIQGKRVYDPRLDITPGADPTNTAYIAWSSNPALCLADFLMASTYGGGYDSTEIDWTTVVTAANYCDGLVNIPGGLTQKRYTCNGTLFANEDFVQNVKAIVDSMLGRIIFRDGKWRMYAGSWQTPTFTIPKNAWVSNLSLQFEQGRERRFNRSRVFFLDAARNYQRVECTPQSNAGFLSNDYGNRNELETEQLLCTNEYEAQRKGIYLLRQSRNQITIAGTLPPAYQDIALWDTGTIVFDFLGWTSKTFRAVNITLRPDGALDCVFSEEQESDWFDIDPTNYNGQAISNFPTQNATTPSEPTSFTAAEQINGTILFTIGTPIVKPFGTKYQIIRSTNSADASVGTVVWQGDASHVPLVMPTSIHWYYARSILTTAVQGFDPSTIVSAYQPNTFGVMARSLPEPTNRYGKDLVSDPEVMFSSENGRFWLIPNDPISTGVYSISLIGGSIAGRLITKANSVASSVADNALRYIFAIPNSPYPRAIPGRRIQLSMRYRALTSIASKGVNVYRHFVTVFGWTGSNSFNLNNDLQILNDFTIDVRSSNGAMPSSGQYAAVSTEIALANGDYTTYPNLVCGLQVATNQNSSQNTSGANSGDMFEFDSIYVGVL